MEPILILGDKMKKSDKILLGIMVIFYSFIIIAAFTNWVIDWSAK